MDEIRVSLASLAPDSFILGSDESIRQFYPTKVLELPEIRSRLSHRTEEIRGEQGPWAVEIHPTSACSLRCVHCSYATRNSDHSELSSEVMHRLLDELEDFEVGSLIFSGGGDPLAWQAGRLADIIDSNTRYRRAISTNGLGLSANLGVNALSKLDIVQINVNGYDEESFSRITRTKSFAKYLSELRWLFSHRIKGVTQISAKVLIDRHNYLLVNRYLEFCEDIGFDLINIKLAGNFELDQDVELTEGEKLTLRHLIMASPVLDRYAARLDAISTLDNSSLLPLPKKCWTVELGLYMLVRSNGDIFLCVTSPFDGANRIGNIKEGKLRDIWMGDNCMAVKSKLSKDMSQGICKLNICRHLRYDMILDENRRDREYTDTSYPSSSIPKLL